MDTLLIQLKKIHSETDNPSAKEIYEKTIRFIENGKKPS